MTKSAMVRPSDVVSAITSCVYASVGSNNVEVWLYTRSEYPAFLAERVQLVLTDTTLGHELYKLLWRTFNAGVERVLLSVNGDRPAQPVPVSELYHPRQDKADTLFDMIEHLAGRPVIVNRAQVFVPEEAGGKIGTPIYEYDRHKEINTIFPD